MSRPTRAQELGLTEEITQDSDGTYSYSLRDRDGSLLVAKPGFPHEAAAHKSVGNWIRNHYRPNHRPRPEPIQPKSSGPSSQMLTMLRSRAEDNASQAQRLRSQAELLEIEAKRLNAAADILEGPEGNG